ncbi:hypothetical protein [Desulfosporosinus hippei]|uniref:Uncharacterized protein n=1 Tax=Desulfosporosinus hippei DSM 8344 TaxID=1121419 RepID=A0A1G8JLL7_9FIRM|nr:hypothetical protein [Desulfosporosinus hippei]SDI32085.1 hypothetical protein SAMN05443529_13330 [Desulfosporosinus hippei DSM 8344]
MSKFSRIIWSLAILLIVSTTIVFSFGVLIVGAVTLSLYGLYRHYFPKKKFPKHSTRSQMYTFGEVIDIRSEEVHETINLKKFPK